MKDNIEKSGQNENEEPQVTKGFKFRVIMTMVFFVLALVYIIWLLKLI